jgi:hypothetical protein
MGLELEGLQAARDNTRNTAQLIQVEVPTAIYRYSTHNLVTVVE